MHRFHSRGSRAAAPGAHPPAAPAVELGNPLNAGEKGRMDSLPVFMILRDRPVILLGEGAVAEAKARLLARAGARIVRDETANARIAIVAIEDAGQAEAAVMRLKARGVMVNAVDRPQLCDFPLPT